MDSGSVETLAISDPGSRNQLLFMAGTLDRKLQQTAQFLRHLVIIQGFGPLLGHDHQVPGGQPALITPEKFPQQALHAVAPDRFAETPGHHQSQAGTRPLRQRQGDPEMTRVYPSPLGLDPEKFSATAETVRFGEAGGPGDGWGRDGGGAPVDSVRGRTQEHSTGLDRQAFAAPGPAAFDDLAAAPGAHPLQEAVGSGPAQIMWLKRPF